MTEFQEAILIPYLAADLSSALILAYKSRPLIDNERGKNVSLVLVTCRRSVNLLRITGKQPLQT